MSNQSIKIERRMSPNRFVAVYKDVDRNGTTITRYEEDVDIKIVETLVGIPRGS